MWYNPRMEKPSLMRFLHASPNSPAVDIYVNDRLIVSGLPYKKYTQYYQIMPGMYGVKIYPAGNKEQLVFETMLNVPPEAIVTSAAINKLEDLEVYPISDMTYEDLSLSERNDDKSTCGCSMYESHKYNNQITSQCINDNGNNMCQSGPMMYDQNNMMYNQGQMMYDQNNMVCNQGQMMCDENIMMCNQGQMMYDQNNMVCNQGQMMCGENIMMSNQGQMMYDQNNMTCNQGQMMCDENNIVCNQGQMMYDQNYMMCNQGPMMYCPGQMMIEEDEEEMIEAPGDTREFRDNNNQMAYVRFIHLSPNAPAVDITLPDGRMLFSNVDYKDVTDYIQVVPGAYTLQVRPFGSNQVVLTIPDIQIEPGKALSLYAVGLVGETPPLEALVLFDGE